MLKDAGYYTFGIGKMHWHPQRVKHGFEGTLLDESGRVEDENFTSDYRQWFQTKAPGKNPDATGIGWNDHTASIYKLPENLHPTYWTGEMACELISNYDPTNKPLFLKVSFARPHSPYDPPQRYLDMYKDALIPDPAIGDWCGKYAKKLNPEETAQDAPYGNFGNEYARNSKRHYYANITFIDEQIGRIIQTLKEKDMYNDALIVFVSDHGDMMGAHGLMMKSVPCFEEIYHIPLVMKLPHQQKAGTKAGFYVCTQEIAPTVLELVGCRSLSGKHVGESVVPWLSGEKTDSRHAFAEFFGQRYFYTQRIFWKDQMKYVFNAFDDDELYDLASDPDELMNVIDQQDYQEIKKELCAQMWEVIKETEDATLADAEYYLMRFAPVGPGEKKLPGSYTLYNKTF